MSSKSFFGIIVTLCLIGVCSPLTFAQATFSVGSSSTTGADIGVAELTGAINLTIFSGRTVEASFSIKYSAQITNNAELEIAVAGTGALNPVRSYPSLDRANNAILIRVPAGGVLGNTIQISGVRVALAGQNYRNVTASITSTTAGGNAIISGQDTVTVIDKILQPFAVDLTTLPALLWENGQILNPATNIVVTEGYPAAFSPKRSGSGQTVPTEVQITPFPSLPAGVKLTFASVATSIDTGATITTLSGVPETVPRKDGSTNVIYAFSAALPSADTIESFPIQVTVALDPDSTASGTITFQAELVPIGIAVPNDDFPSKAIPRYAERLVPDESELITGAVLLAFPYRKKSDGTYTGIAITNPQNFRISVTFTAYDANGNLVKGTGITNPVTMILPRMGQIAKLATDIFGVGFNTATSGTIIADGRTPVMEGFYLIGDEAGGSRLDGSTADITPFNISLLPAVFHQGPTPYNLIEIYNSGTDKANVLLKLHDSNGVQISSAILPEIPVNGSLTQDLTAIFPRLDLNAFSGGYLICRSDVPVVARETFGNALDSNVLVGQSGLQRKSIPIAHFAQGGGYSSELNIVNEDAATPAVITLTALDNSGTPLAITGNPLKITIEPGKQLVQAVDELFPSLGASLTTGYLQMDVLESSVGYFTTTPVVLGSIRFSAADGYASAALPTIIAPAEDFVYSHVAQNLGYFTGITLLNTNATLTTVTLDVYTKDGTWVGVATTTLQPHQKLAKLLYELVATSAGQVGGYVLIHASQPIVSFALFGTDDGRSLSAIPPQPVD